MRQQEAYAADDASLRHDARAICHVVLRCYAHALRAPC